MPLLVCYLPVTILSLSTPFSCCNHWYVLVTVITMQTPSPHPPSPPRYARKAIRAITPQSFHHQLVVTTSTIHSLRIVTIPLPLVTNPSPLIILDTIVIITPLFLSPLRAASQSWNIIFHHHRLTDLHETGTVGNLPPRQGYCVSKMIIITAIKSSW